MLKGVIIMLKLRKSSLLFFIIILCFGLLTACTPQEKDAKETASSSTETASKTRTYKDYKGHEMEIPTSPKRVVFHGESFGDLVALNFNAVGSASSWYKGHIYESKVKNVEDVGFPINLEKTLSLNPDLIIFGGTEEKDYEALSKIAPTIIFDTFAPLDKRMEQLGDILGKKEEASAWLNEYNTKSKKMWADLVSSNTIKQGETATVLTYYPGNRLFVMASTGLSQVLYSEGGFKPKDKIQKFLDEDLGFQEISLESLPEYAGDRIFILTPSTTEEQTATEKMINSKLWKEIPAVKNGNVYNIDINKSNSDASTRDWLIEELPKMLKK